MCASAHLDMSPLSVVEHVFLRRVGGAAYGGGGGGGGGNQNIATSTKIFVGGLAPAVEESDFRAYFENFGKIVDCQIMLDHHTQRSRGYVNPNPASCILYPEACKSNPLCMRNACAGS
jgi:hypothetical protein